MIKLNTQACCDFFKPREWPDADLEKCSAVSEHEGSLRTLFYEEETRSCDQIDIWIAESKALELLQSQDGLKLADVMNICTGREQMNEWRKLFLDEKLHSGKKLKSSRRLEPSPSERPEVDSDADTTTRRESKEED